MGGPRIEIVGKDEAEKFFAESELNEMALDEMIIDTLSGEAICGIERLSLRDNLLSCLGEVVELCNNLPSLSHLDMSGNKFSCSTSCTKNFSLQELVINSAQMDLNSDIGNFLSRFENLKSLSLDGNFFRSLFSLPGKLERLCLQNIGLDSWSDIQELTGNLAHLTYLDISENPKLGAISHREICACPISSLLISNCGIDEWESVVNLSVLRLQHLKLTDNKVYQDPIARQVLIALFPELKTLNNAIISKSARTDAEKYISSLGARGDGRIKKILPEARLNELVTIYQPVGSVGEVRSTNKCHKLTISLNLIGGKSIRVPKNCKISDLKSIIARKTEWPFSMNEMEVWFSHSSSGEDRYQLNSEVDESTDGSYVFTVLIDK
jgi:hypothetical protein